MTSPKIVDYLQVLEVFHESLRESNTEEQLFQKTIPNIQYIYCQKSENFFTMEVEIKEVTNYAETLNFLKKLRFI